MRLDEPILELVFCGIRIPTSAVSLDILVRMLAHALKLSGRDSLEGAREGAGHQWVWQNQLQLLENGRYPRKGVNTKSGEDMSHCLVPCIGTCMFLDYKFFLQV